MIHADMVWFSNREPRGEPPPSWLGVVLCIVIAALLLGGH